MLGMSKQNVLWIAVVALVLGGCCCPTTCGPDPCAVWRPTAGPTAAAVTPLAAPAAPEVAIKPSGFLDSYRGLRQSKEHPGTWIWMKDGLDLRAYDYLLFDPIQVILDEKDREIVNEEMRKKASEAFREILYETLEPYYDIVEEPGENVLRVRIALTDLEPTPAMEAGKPPIGTGGAELEAMLVDAQSGETLLRLVSRIEGSKRGEVAKPEWQAVEGAFREWADRMLVFLDSFQEK